jgi:hypothetical protein
MKPEHQTITIELHFPFALVYTVSFANSFTDVRRLRGGFIESHFECLMEPFQTDWGVAELIRALHDAFDFVVACDAVVRWTVIDTISINVCLQSVAAKVFSLLNKTIIRKSSCNEKERTVCFPFKAGESTEGLLEPQPIFPHKFLAAARERCDK